MKVESIPAADLLPHGPEMTLIDGLLESSDERTVAVVRITAASEFAGSTGVPAFVGIEYMAQTIAARVGFEAYRDGLPPPIGFLLGTRSYLSELPEFPFGSELVVTVKPLFVEAGFGAFACEIVMDHEVASAILNTYQPSAEDIAQLKGEA